MFTHFIIRDFLLESLASRSSGLALKSYKIDGVETLTDAFFVDNQVVSVNPSEDYMFCRTQGNGSQPLILTLDPLIVNTYNPFAKSLGLLFSNVAGQPSLKRGFVLGTLNGNDYGEGVLNFGCLFPSVMTGEGTYVNGAFHIDIDYTKDLYIEFDIITNIIGENVYEEPQVLKKYKIIWDKKNCYHEFSYFSFQTNTNYLDNVYGFLNGLFYVSDLNPYIDFSSIECGNNEVVCVNKERTISFANYVNIPTVGVSPDEVFKECCYTHLTLADANSNDDFKNDYSSFYHQRQLPTEIADFVLVHFETSTEYDLNDATFGTFFEFGSFPTNINLKGFLVSWKKVLDVLGEGNYKIIKRINIAGIPLEFPSISFTLKQFTSSVANYTVRMDVVMSGRLQKSGIDFTGTGWKHSIRVPGFFGRREAQFEEDNIINRQYEKRQVSMKQMNEYKVQTNKIPDCLTKEILDFNLFANDIFINDYNLNNHSYDFVKFGIKFASNDGTVYGVRTRKAQLNLTFNDKFENNLKRNFK